MSLPSVERLREVFTYSPATGILKWRVSCGTARAGDVAGNVTARGYMRTCLDRRFLLVHRIAWAMMTGEWPKARIDHRDVDGTNNRWSNLRLGTHSQNMANRGPQKNNASGFKGVHRVWNRWVAKIQIDRKSFHLGSFGTPEEAHAAYLAAAENFYGEFARAA